MKYLVPKKTRTILVLFLLINLMPASPLMSVPIRADGLLPTDATAVSPILDEARAVKELISTEGGQITATAADGTRFTLVVPQEALLSDLELTMTPVAQVGQLPLSGGLVAAVQLEPEGLLLWEPASLTIEPAVPIDVTEQLSFTWHEQGEGFHMYPLQIDPSSITMKLVHFSGYGVGRGTDAEADAAVPPGEQDRLEWATEKLTRKERKFRYQNQAFAMEHMQSATASKNKNKKRNRKLCTEFSEEAIGFFNILRKGMDSALASQKEKELRCYLNIALMWERFARIEQAFNSCLPSELSGAYEFLADFRLNALKVLSDKAYERCGSNVAEALRLMRLEKEALRYVFSPSADGDDLSDLRFSVLAANIGEKAEKCARFELQFESVTENPASVIHVRATVPIQYDPKIKPLAESPLEHVSFSVKLEGTRAGDVQGSTFEVVDMEFDLNLREDRDCSGADEPEATLVSMTIWPGIPLETIIDNEGVSIKATFWAGPFAELHEMEFDSAAEGYVIRDWSKGQNQLLARKTYVRSNGFVSEGTALNLFHRPE